MNKFLSASLILVYTSIILTYLLLNKNVTYTLPILILLSIMTIRKGISSLLSSLALGPTIHIIYNNFLGGYYTFLSVPISLLAIHGSIIELNLSYEHIPRFRRLGFTCVLILSAFIISLIFLIFDIKIIALSTTYVAYLIAFFQYTTHNLDKLSIQFPNKILGIRDELHEYSFKVLNKGHIDVGILMPNVEDSSYILTLSPSSAIVESGKYINGKIKLHSSKIGKYTSTLTILIYDTKGLIIKKYSIKTDIIIKPKLTIAIERARRLLASLGVGSEIAEEMVMPVLYGQTKSRTGEFIGCREYTPGDDPKAIHIKKSVEKQKLIIKEFEQIGIAPIFIMVDVGVSTPEELDEVLYNTIQVIIHFILNRRVNVGMVVYNDEGYLIKMPNINPLHLLKKFIVMIDQFSPISKAYKFNLDQQMIFQIKYSNTELAKIHMKFLLNRFIRSLLYDILVWISNTSEKYTEIYVVKSGGKYLPLYPIFKLYGENLGHRITIIDKSFMKKILVYS